MKPDNRLTDLSPEERERVWALVAKLKLRRLDSRNDPKSSDNKFWIGLAISLGKKTGAEAYMDYCREHNYTIGSHVREFIRGRCPASLAIRVNDQLRMVEGRLKAGSSLIQAFKELGFSINPLIKYAMTSWLKLDALAATFRPAALEFLEQFPEYATNRNLEPYVLELQNVDREARATVSNGIDVELKDGSLVES